MERPPRRRLRRLFGRLTAATLGAASIAAVPADLDPPGLELPHSDDADPRHAAAAHWLAVSLERMAPLAATHTACRWALSSDPGQRLTMASALEWTFPLLGDGSIIDHLSRDPAPDVRAAAARAAWVRHALVGDEVLARLASDPAPEVREVAQLASRGR
jgi:hypothetical protein